MPNNVDTNQVLIIGGGTAGISAALSLAERGVPSMIIENKEFGGMAEALACKGRVECVRCDVCLAHDKITESKRSPLIRRIGRSELIALDGRPGEYRATVIFEQGGTQEVSAASIIVSTGMEPFDPSVDKRLGYGSVTGVVTAQDMEGQLLREGALTSPDGNKARSIGFIQCVGSRDIHLGIGYCSRACCKYSLKLAQFTKKLDPEIEISYYFMDWRPCDAQDDLYAWARSTSKVELLRSRPSEIVQGEDGRPEVRFTSPIGENVDSKQHDLVVLSQGIRPSSTIGHVCSILGLERDENGFVKSRESDPCSTNQPGIFVAGCARAPMDLVDAASDGVIAAGKAHSFLEGSG